MPNQTPGPTSLADLLGQLAAGQIPADPHKPSAELRDDPRRIQAYLFAAQTSADAAARYANCGCPACKVAIFEAKVGAYLLGETVRAAYTGDVSKLEAVANFVEHLKSGGK